MRELGARDVDKRNRLVVRKAVQLEPSDVQHNLGHKLRLRQGAQARRQTRAATMGILEATRPLSAFRKSTRACGAHLPMTPVGKNL